MDELGVLRDAHPAQSFDRARARDAARANLMTAVGSERGKRGWLRKTGLRPIAVALAVGVSALVFVPIGGASLGSRAVHEISSLWETPANQPALDQAADDAQSIAGTAYYTDARVDAADNTVDVYLANAPQSIIDQLNAKHPGIYVINNNAAHPLSQLLQVEHSLPQRIDGITIAIAYPTSDGYLKVGVEGTDVQTAQAALDSSVGAGIIHVFGGAHPTDFSPYKGG